MSSPGSWLSSQSLFWFGWCLITCSCLQSRIWKKLLFFVFCLSLFAQVGVDFYKSRVHNLCHLLRAFPVWMPSYVFLRTVWRYFHSVPYDAVERGVGSSLWLSSTVNGLTTLSVKIQGESEGGCLWLQLGWDKGGCPWLQLGRWHLSNTLTCRLLTPKIRHRNGMLLFYYPFPTREGKCTKSIIGASESHRRHLCYSYGSYPFVARLMRCS